MSVLSKEERDKLYAKDVIRSFLPKGVKFEDCEHIVVELPQNATPEPREGQCSNTT